MAAICLDLRGLGTRARTRLIRRATGGFIAGVKTKLQVAQFKLSYSRAFFLRA